MDTGRLFILELVEVAVRQGATGMWLELASVGSFDLRRYRQNLVGIEHI